MRWAAFGWHWRSRASASRPDAFTLYVQETSLQAIRAAPHASPQANIRRLTDFTVLANLLGAPALAFPCSVPGGLPASCQLMAAPGQDALLLGLAQSLDTLQA